MKTPKKHEIQKSPPAFPHVENEMPAVLGIGLPALVLMRNELLVESVDFIRWRRRVCWSTEAYAKVADRLGFALSQPKARVTELKKMVTLVVTAHKTLNPHIILAAVRGTTTLLRVRVKSKENFRPYMEVRTTHDSGDLYHLVGNCPRSPGKY